jgi:glycosyltransferase involved in cell wall biosynthesis
VKGVRYIVEALSRSALRKLLIKLVVIGDGPKKEKRQRQALAACLSHCIRFVGFVLYDDLP